MRIHGKFVVFRFIIIIIAEADGKNNCTNDTSIVDDQWKHPGASYHDPPPNIPSYGKNTSVSGRINEIIDY